MAGIVCGFFVKCHYIRRDREKFAMKARDFIIDKSKVVFCKETTVAKQVFAGEAKEELADNIWRRFDGLLKGEADKVRDFKWNEVDSVLDKVANRLGTL